MTLCCILFSNLCQHSRDLRAEFLATFDSLHTIYKQLSYGTLEGRSR